MVEAEMIRILEEIVPFPAHIDFDRFSFAQKTSLVAAHGFIRANDIGAYRALNKLRNEIAHDLDAEPGPRELANLIAAFGPHLRMLKGEVEDDDWQRELGAVVAVLFLALEGERNKFVAHRESVRRVTADLHSDRESQEEGTRS